MNPSQAIPVVENQPVSFPCWKDALQRAPVSVAQRSGYHREILAFLRHCKIKRAPATIMLVKQYLAEQERQGPSESREALRWFFRAARQVRGGERMADVSGRCEEGGRQPVSAVQPREDARRSDIVRRYRNR